MEQDVQSSLTRKRSRLVLVAPPGTDGAPIHSYAAANIEPASPLPPPATAARNSTADATAAGAQNIGIRIHLGNSCQSTDHAWKTWIAFVEIGPSRAAWLEKVMMRFKSGDKDTLEDIPASDSPGVFLSSPRKLQHPIEIHIELHWKSDFLETPRISDITHMLNLEKSRNERTIVVRARTRTLGISPSGDDPNVDVPRSAVGSHDALLKCFRSLFRRWHLAHPDKFESSCKRLRKAVEDEHFDAGTWTISSTQAEPIIQEVAAALRKAGHKVANEIPTQYEHESAEEPMQIRGILRPPRRSRLQTTGKNICFRGHDCPGDLLEPICIDSFKELRSSLWYEGAGLRACCEDCGAFKTGKLHGGTLGINSTRDLFYCHACLHKRSLMDWEVTDMPCDTAVKVELEDLTCESCGKSVEKDQARHWHDNRLARHTNCEECYERWERRFRRR